MKETDIYEKLGYVRSNIRTEIGKAVQADETWSSTPHVSTNCQALTKTGVVCSARPVRSGHLCVGHLRQAEAES